MCATIGLLFAPFSSAGLGNADAGAKKEFLTFVTVKEMKVRGAYEEIGTIWTAHLDGTSGVASPPGMCPTSPRTAGGLPLSTVRTSSG